MVGQVSNLSYQRWGRTGWKPVLPFSSFQDIAKRHQWLLCGRLRSPGSSLLSLFAPFKQRFHRTNQYLPGFQWRTWQSLCQSECDLSVENDQKLFQKLFNVRIFKPSEDSLDPFIKEVILSPKGICSFILQIHVTDTRCRIIVIHSCMSIGHIFMSKSNQARLGQKSSTLGMADYI